MPKQKRPFVVEIEAKLTVHAFDEDSARKKVEKAFASGRVLALDVSAGAGVWTYAASYRSWTRRPPERHRGPASTPQASRQRPVTPIHRQTADARPAAGAGTVLAARLSF